MVNLTVEFKNNNQSLIYKLFLDGIELTKTELDQILYKDFDWSKTDFENYNWCLKNYKDVLKWIYNHKNKGLIN